MADVVATGPLSTPFAELAELLAASTTFQSELGAADATEALALIEYPYWDVRTQGWPIGKAVITDDDTLEQEKNRNTDQSGSLYLWFCFAPSTLYTDDPKNHLKEWRNTLGAILDEMLELARNPKPDPNVSPYFNMIRWTKTGTPTLEREKKQLFRFAEFRIDWN